jgi:hypothetical protein
MGMYCSLYRLSLPDAYRLDRDPKLVVHLLNTEPTDGSYLSLEKAWHGLHYLLTGSAKESLLPLSFILNGGSDIGPDLSYGPARLLSVEFVKDLDVSLKALTIDDIWTRFDPEKMSVDKIYPFIWDEVEEELKDEYGWYFEQLKGFVRDASNADQAIVIVVT